MQGDRGCAPTQELPVLRQARGHQDGPGPGKRLFRILCPLSDRMRGQYEAMRMAPGGRELLEPSDVRPPMRTVTGVGFSNRRFRSVGIVHTSRSEIGCWSSTGLCSIGRVSCCANGWTMPTGLPRASDSGFDSRVRQCLHDLGGVRCLRGSRERHDRRLGCVDGGSLGGSGRQIHREDYHLLPGRLLGFSVVSATMSIAGLSIRRKAARAFVYVVPFLFGVAPSIGID